MRTIALSRLRLGLPVVYYAESDIKCDIPVFLFIATAPTEISTLSLHDALPICQRHRPRPIDRFGSGRRRAQRAPGRPRALRRDRLRALEPVARGRRYALHPGVLPHRARTTHRRRRLLPVGAALPGATVGRGGYRPER